MFKHEGPKVVGVDPACRAVGRLKHCHAPRRARQLDGPSRGKPGDATTCDDHAHRGPGVGGVRTRMFVAQTRRTEFQSRSGSREPSAGTNWVRTHARSPPTPWVVPNRTFSHARAPRTRALHLPARMLHQRIGASMRAAWRRAAAQGPSPLARGLASSSSGAGAATPGDSVRPKTGIVMLNMGGPSTLDEVNPFLNNLFSDREIIQLGPLQDWLVRGRHRRCGRGVATASRDGHGLRRAHTSPSAGRPRSRSSTVKLVAALQSAAGRTRRVPRCASCWTG